MMKKRILVAGVEYDLELDDEKKGQTVACYRLLVPEKKIDYAIKLYHSWDYLSLEDITRLQEFYLDSFPICLSNYPVFDEKCRYIGSASSYIEENYGQTEEVIYQVPLEKIYSHLSQLEEKIALVTTKNLVLWDWGLGNLLYGKGQDLSLGLYMIDDNGYYFDSGITFKENHQELSYLINDIIARFVFRYAESLKDPISEMILSPYLKSEDLFFLIERREQRLFFTPRLYIG